MPRPGADAVLLVTGFPSFYARRMVEHILTVEPSSFVYMIVDEARASEAEAFMAAMVAAKRDRAALLTGSATAMDFGLSGAEFRKLTGEVDRIHHMVHTTDAAADRKTAEAINIGSAIEIIEIARATTSLQCLVFHSTATVSGDRQGVVYEGELDEGQSFRSVIGETRMRAEAAVRRAMRSVPIAVVRPTTLVGGALAGGRRVSSPPPAPLREGAPRASDRSGQAQDAAAAGAAAAGAAAGAPSAVPSAPSPASAPGGGPFVVPPGESERLEGIYLLILLLIATPSDLAIPLPGGTGDVPLHVVPIDYAVRAAHAIGRHPTAPGRTFHVADPKPPSARRVIELVNRAGRKRAARGYIPSDLAKTLLRTPGIERFVRSPRAFIEQLLTPVRYDMRDTDAALEGTGIVCPPFEAYVDQLVAAVEEHVRSRRERRAVRREAEVEDPLS